MSTPPVPAGWVSAEELAARLGVTAGVVRRHARQGTGGLPPAYRIAGRWVWAAGDLEDVDDHRTRPGRPAGSRDRKPRTRRTTTPTTPTTPQTDTNPGASDEGEQR